MWYTTIWRTTAVLVTSSMVAVRGLVRSLHSNFGFEPLNSMLAQNDLSMAGYRGDAVPAMQRRTWIPAQRALSLDPVILLREE
jgi:hypothetical protein